MTTVYQFPGGKRASVRLSSGEPLCKQITARYACVAIGDVDGIAEAVFRGIDLPEGMQPKFSLNLGIPSECIVIDEVVGKAAVVEVLNGRATGSIIRWERVSKNG